MNPACPTSPCQACCFPLARVILFFLLLLLLKPERTGVSGQPGQARLRGCSRSLPLVPSSPSRAVLGEPMAGPRGPSGDGKRRRPAAERGLLLLAPYGGARAGLSPRPAPSALPGRGALTSPSQPSKTGFRPVSRFQLGQS